MELITSTCLLLLAEVICTHHPNSELLKALMVLQSSFVEDDYKLKHVWGSLCCREKQEA